MVLDATPLKRPARAARVDFLKIQAESAAKPALLARIGRREHGLRMDDLAAETGQTKENIGTAINDFVESDAVAKFGDLLIERLTLVHLADKVQRSVADFHARNPLVAGISYEIIRYSAKHPKSLLRIVTLPGLLLQKITTKEPDETQLEIAIRALEEALTV